MSQSGHTPSTFSHTVTVTCQPELSFGLYIRWPHKHLCPDDMLSVCMCVCVCVCARERESPLKHTQLKGQEGNLRTSQAHGIKLPWTQRCRERAICVPSVRVLPIKDMGTPRLRERERDSKSNYFSIVPRFSFWGTERLYFVLMSLFSFLKTEPLSCSRQEILWHSGIWCTGYKVYCRSGINCLLCLRLQNMELEERERERQTSQLST